MEAAPLQPTSVPRASAPPGSVRRAPVLVQVFTVPMSLRFLDGQASYMREAGFRVHAVASPGADLEQFAEREGVAVHAVEMPRRITPLHDLGAVRRLARLLRALRPDVVHANTPKGGLLGMIAAWLCRVPVRGATAG